jgi:ABC-2 type transport system permease protein
LKNIWIICQKELKSYFSSPIAYLLMAIFAVIFGFFFYSATAFFVIRGMESQMMGRSMPMDVNEWVIRPLLSNASVIALFLIPMITMRLYAEEKRSGTMELLMTSPVRDIEIIVGKFIASLVMFGCIIGVSALDLAALFAYGKPDWKPILVGYLGLLLQGGALIAIGTFISTTTKNQIIAGGATFAVCLLLWVLDWVSSYEQAAWAKVVS